jgi:ribonuclease HI
VFAWRVATDSLATKKNKWRRTLETNATCDICGTEVEDAFHATVRCSKARALRDSMRKVWTLPNENLFRYSGEDWLQHLLDPLNDITKARVILLLWRSWHLRNDIIHHKGDETIAKSAIFLQSYLGETYNPTVSSFDAKGKQCCDFFVCRDIAEKNNGRGVVSWEAPQHGWVKLNTDGAFCSKDGSGGAGWIIRDSNGVVVAAASVQLNKCSDAEDAEARAVLLGLKSFDISQCPKLIIETDCSAVCKALQDGDSNRSKAFATYEEAKSIVASFSYVHMRLIRREANAVADALARDARSGGDRSYGDAIPAHIRELVNNDCKLLGLSYL